jgi:hypothetical protein
LIGAAALDNVGIKPIVIRLMLLMSSLWMKLAFSFHPIQGKNILVDAQWSEKGNKELVMVFPRSALNSTVSARTGATAFLIHREDF